ncbi:hypothetical protein [Halobacterium yunchengense]|uniref:hypothetical protein n=1 Tax=Halobacterium yunchengense TaxID=3108497 RepID=UPI00300834CF
MQRRQFLAAAGSVPAAGVAGCLGSPAADADTTDAATTAPTDERATDAATSGAATDGTATDGTATADGEADGTATADGEADLDLREANVTGVAVERTDGGVRFDVTLYHDDDGEDGYANWWQVESLGGDRLGRRDLAHAHGTREFTRSATVDVGDATCVVVRGHDQTHEYGGQVALVDVASGTVRFGRQGPEPESFDAADCP